MAWVAALVAAAYQGYSSHQKNQQAKKANARNAALFGDQGPDYVGNAIAGYEGGNQFQRDLTGIAQGTYFNPLALARPINMLNKAGDTNMQRVAATLGRSNMSGGLANAYALSNQIGTQGNKSALVQNYGLWREKQRRADLGWINDMRNTDLNRRAGLNKEIADRYENTTSPWADAAGSFIGSYAGSSSPNFFQGFGSNKGNSNIQVGPYKDPYKDNQGKPWWAVSY
jgi:hypothetical protein